MAQLDYVKARGYLQTFFDEAERSFADKPSNLSEVLNSHIDILFASNTQAYREVLVGCLIARLLNKSINIRGGYTLDSNDHNISGFSTLKGPNLLGLGE